MPGWTFISKEEWFAAGFSEVDESDTVDVMNLGNELLTNQDFIDEMGYNVETCKESS